MANPDRPRGFTPVHMLSGSAWAGNVRSIGVTDAADIFIGDALSLVTNLGKIMTTADATMLGVAVGFGKKDAASGQYASAYNPDNLTTLYYDDSASTHTDWRVFYVPFDDMVFEVQSNADLDAAAGDIVDLIGTAGNTATGRSNHEIGAGTTDFRIVEIPAYPDNDSTLTNTRYWVTALKSKLIWD